jgi:hypothetical protein
VSVILNKLIRASVIASALTVTGIVANTTSAFAVDQTVNFQGIVAPTCAFSNVVDGALGVEAANINAISERGVGGRPGSVDLTCNSGAQVSVSLPVNNGSSVTVSPSWQAGTVMTSAGEAMRDSGGFLNQNIIGPVQEQLSVGMYVVNGFTPFPAGTYNYNVVVTANPQ